MSKKDKNNIAALKTKRTKKAKKVSSKRRRGILGFLFMIADCISNFFKRGVMGLIFAGLYDKINHKWKNGYVYNLFRLRHKKRSHRLGLVHRYEMSKTNSQILNISKGVVHSKLSIWGFRFFLFSFATCIISVIKKYYIPDEANIFFINLEPLFSTASEDLKIIVSIIVMCFSLPLIFSKKELGEALLSKKLTRFIITDVLNLNAHNFKRTSSASEGSYFISIMLSMSMGLCTFFIDAILVINLMLLFVMLVLCLSFPELGILTLLASVPFATVFPHPNTYLVFLVLLTLMGYISKFIRGRRVLRFDFIDILVLALGVLLIFSGIFTCGDINSLKPADIYLTFLLIYFLIVNMYLRKPGIYRGFKVMVITGFILSIIGIVNAILSMGIINFSWLQSGPAQYIINGMGNMVGEFKTMGIYLALVYPLAMAQMLVTRNKLIKTLYMILVTTILLGAVITLDRTVCIGIVVATVVFMLVYNFRSIWFVLAGVGVTAGAFAFLPSHIIEPIKAIFVMSEAEVAHKLELWDRIGEVIGDNIFTGIGLGRSVFNVAFNPRVLSDGSPIISAENLFLQIFLELGIVGFVLFIFMLVSFGQKCHASANLKNGKSRSRTIICAGYTSVVTACVMGLNQYIWLNYRNFLAFWIILALTVALTKVNEKEAESGKVMNNMRSVDIQLG